MIRFTTSKWPLLWPCPRANACQFYAFSFWAFYGVLCQNCLSYNLSKVPTGCHRAWNNAGITGRTILLVNSETLTFFEIYKSGLGLCCSFTVQVYFLIKDTTRYIPLYPPTIFVDNCKKKRRLFQDRQPVVKVYSHVVIIVTLIDKTAWFLVKHCTLCESNNLVV